MAQLNYNHLHYFYIVAKEGSITKAAEVLHLTPQTISGQLSAFEDYIGFQLFDRQGKQLILNERGQLAFNYAQDIFDLGSELQNSLFTQEITEQTKFVVGITDVIPKVFSYNLLKSVFEMDEPIRLICQEGSLEDLLSDLAVNKIDLIISDRELPPGSKVRAYSHLLGETGLSFYAANRFSRKLKSKFPESLDGQPFLISGEKSSQKNTLLTWFQENDVHPNIIAEFDDSALLKYFGQAGDGVFCTSSAIESHITDQYKVTAIGSTDEIRERFYAISPERKINHPAVKFLVNQAKQMF